MGTIISNYIRYTGKYIKKVLLIIGLLLTVTIVITILLEVAPAYEYKTLEIMYDSKKRPHKIVIYSRRVGMAAVDTYKKNTYK